MRHCLWRRAWIPGRARNDAQRGTTLIEILVAAAILGLVLTSIVSIITLSVKDAAEAKSRALAVKYGQEGLEFFRNIKSAEGRDSLVQQMQVDGATVGGAAISFCLPTIPSSYTTFAALSPSTCSFSTQSQYVDARQIFQRQANISLTQNGALIDLNVSVVMKWMEGSTVKQTSTAEKYETTATWETQPATVYQQAPRWKYRAPFTVTNNAGGAFGNYQVQLTLNTAALVSAAKMNSDCSDLRIRASDGTTDYTFWIEPTTCNTAATKIWTKMPTVAIGANTVYAYYGNPSATSPGWLTTDVFVREIPNVVLAAFMNEASWNGTAGEVKDASGNNNNGTAACTGGYGSQGGNGGCTVPSTSPGIFVYSGLFNGSTQYVNVPDASSLQFGTGDFTASAWVYPNVVSYGTGAEGEIISKNYSNGFEFGVFQGTLLAYVAGVGAVGTRPVTVGNWQQLALVRRSGVVYMYVNGVQDSVTYASGGNVSAAGTPINLANRPGATNGWLNGYLDDARIYNRALTAAEITDLFGWAAASREGYVTPNYPGKELVRNYYYTGVATVGGAGAEQVLY